MKRCLAFQVTDSFFSIRPKRVPATASSLVARSELTPEEAQHARDKKRKAKKQDRKHLGDMAELYSKSKKGGAKDEKERALQGLVKSGKGVT
ncbi:MAG: hypothetical protein EOP04_19145, partial [Proteobacteria bacterium]